MLKVDRKKHSAFEDEYAEERDDIGVPYDLMINDGGDWVGFRD